MKVLLPFTPRTIRPEVVAFVMDTIPVTWQDWRNCAGDDFAYWSALMDRWRAGEDFIVLEHDVVPSSEQWTDLVVCDDAWCQLGYGGHETPDDIGYGWLDNGHPGRAGYPGASSPMLALGCTRFSARFIAMQAERVLSAKPAPWWEVDGRLFSSFSYVPAHRHLGKAQHLKGGVTYARPE